MVGRNNAVFRFVLDIKDFLVKGRRVVQVTNQITGSTTKASGSMDRLASSSQRTGQTMAASAVNFQTMTQGMLNLSTAGIQTYTSFSNLDRAGNRLAMSQIGVSRATDLLNNKQLRLTELTERGLGSSQKAVLLTNELKTARADLLVKTDKLKIEEGALFDIQLLFVANIANVMISSLQTIVTMKNAHVAATIKQVIQERILSTTIFSKTVPALHAQTGALALTNVGMKKVINTQKLLMIGIPVIGGILIAATLAVQAYSENWGGFRDMVVSILPFMKDQKELLGDVTDVLGEASAAGDKLNNTFEEQLGLVFRLPDSYTEAAKGLDKVRVGYEQAAEKAKEFNIEIAKNPQSFRTATQEGGFFTQEADIGSSNVIKTEGDAIHTANAIGSSSYSKFSTNDLMRMASVGVLAQYNPKIVGRQQPTIITNTAGNVFRGESIYDLINPFDPSTAASAQGQHIAETIGKQIKWGTSGLKQAAEDFNEWAKQQKFKLELPTSFPEAFSKLGKGISGDIGLIREDIIGVDVELEKQILASRKRIASDIEGGLRVSRLEDMGKLIPGEGKFIGGGGFFTETGEFTFAGADVTMKGLKNKLSKDKKELSELRSLSLEKRIQLDPMGYRELELVNEITNITGRIDEIETTPEGIKNMLLQDILLKETVHDIVYDQEKYRENQFKEDQKLQRRLALEEIKQDRKNAIKLQIIKGARAAGISESLYAKRTGLGILLKSLPTDPNIPITSAMRKALSSTGLGKAAVGGLNIFKSDKVLEAERLRERLEFGDFRGLSTKTIFDRLIKRSFGRTGGISLSPDDPLLRDISGFGENRAAVYNQRMIDPITGEDMGALGVDIGAVADSISLQEAMRIGRLQKEMSGFTGGTGGQSAGLARAIAQAGGVSDSLLKRLEIGSDRTKTYNWALNTGQISATAAYQVPRIYNSSTGVWESPIKTSAENRRRLDIRDANMNLLRFGGKLREGMTIEEEGSVIGGYSSRQAFSKASRQARYQSYQTGQFIAASFGILANSSIMRGSSSRNTELGRVTSRAAEIKGALASAGLSFKNIGYFDMPSRYSAAQYYATKAQHNADVSFNNNQLAKATQINILEGGFGLSGFAGGAMALPALSDKVKAQDDLMQSIGLSRTEAFQIIDTQGRGREEIDDRLKWKSRLNSISTGNAVL